MTKVIPILLPSEEFERLVNALRVCMSVCGLNVTVSNYRMNWITKIIACNIVIYFVCVTVTIVKVSSYDWGAVLETTSMTASVIQGAIKMGSAILTTDSYFYLCNYLEEKYKEYEQLGDVFRNAAHDCVRKTKLVIMGIGLCYTISACAIIITPFIVYIFTGYHYPMMTFYQPLLDMETHFGYWATISFQFFGMVTGAFGLFAFDSMVVVFFMQSYFFADIFKIKIVQFNEKLEIESYRSSRNCETDLIDIMEWHQQYIKYSSVVNYISFYLINVQVLTSGVSIVESLYIFMTRDFPGVIPYLAISIYSLYVYCILGTQMEYCNDEFEKVIYEIAWYNLSMKQRKMINFMLMKSHSPQLIQIGGYMPLSVTTALAITKLIYSILMLLIQFS